jgi:hypothetical protein
MRVSTLSARWFGFSLLLIAGTVGCAQSETGAPASPTSPSSLSGGPSATAVGPSAGYDASGTWCVVNTDAHGNPVDPPFEQLFSQDPDTGDLLFTDEGQLVRAERLSNGQGKIITYQVSFIGNEGGECDLRIKGTILLDTTTNTFTSANLRLKSLCSNERFGAGVIGTKGSCPAQ